MKRKIIEIKSVNILSGVRIIYPVALVFYFIVFFFAGLFILSVVIKVNAFLNLYDAEVAKFNIKTDIFRLLFVSALNSFLFATFITLILVVVFSFYNFLVGIIGGMKIEVFEETSETRGVAESDGRSRK